MHPLSFASINLRFNPFGELTGGERQTLARVNLEGLVEHLSKDKSCVQFLAGHGRGKTTHLLSLHGHCPDFPYLKLHKDDKPRFEKANGFFIDSIENLSLVNRLHVYRRFRKLAVTTHRDLTREMKLFGFNVKTIRVSTTTTDQLLNIFQSRVEYARRGDGDIPQLCVKHIDGLKNIYGDDVRAMENELYNYFEELRKNNGKV